MLRKIIGVSISSIPFAAAFGVFLWMNWAITVFVLCAVILFIDIIAASMLLFDIGRRIYYGEKLC